MITAYIVNTSLLPQSCLRMCEGLLDEQEKQRKLKLRRNSDRRSYAVAHALLRCELSSFVQCSPSAFYFQRSTYGKPRAYHPTCKISFNISHSGYYIAVATSSKETDIGIDIQRYDEIECSLNFVATVLGASELENLILEKSPCRMHRLFIRYWAIKEAYLKATGSGLITDMREVEVSECFKWVGMRGTEKFKVHTWQKDAEFFAALITHPIDFTSQIKMFGESAAEKCISDGSRDNATRIL